MAVDNIARGLAASALKKGGVTTEQLEEGLAKKLDKAGGTIGGNIVITGDLTVNGTQHINNTENLNVENAMIYSNATGATLATNGGIGIKKDATDVYGIVYDPTSDSVKLGLGESDTNGVFTFNENEGQPVAIRDDSSKFTNNNLVKWDSTNHKLVDAGQSVDNLINLNALTEAKLNENIIKDPSKTYLVWKGNQFPNSTGATFKAPAGCTIDWGDGNVETFEVASTTVNTHTYSDGIEYHLISITDSATTLAESAFFACRELISISLSNNLTSIDQSAFRGCNGVTSLMIPSSVKSIGVYTFDACSSLTSITIPDSVTLINWYAFDFCRALTSVTIGSGIRNIGDNAFKDCNKLKTVKISATTPPTLGSDAFETSIEKIIVPKSAINAYKAKSGWSTYADKIVYEVDSSDLGNVEVDNRTITKTPNEEIQAVALTNGTDLLTYAEILQATTIERL